jgi:hypothetical protein
MTEVQLLIGDRDAAASSAATFVRQNPISGEERRAPPPPASMTRSPPQKPPRKPFLPGPRSVLTNVAKSFCAPPTCWKLGRPISFPS